MATGPIETHLHHSFNWENGAPGAREGPRGRSVNCGSEPSAQCVRLRSEINLICVACLDQIQMAKFICYSTGQIILAISLIPGTQVILIQPLMMFLKVAKHSYKLCDAATRVVTCQLLSDLRRCRHCRVCGALRRIGRQLRWSCAREHQPLLLSYRPSAALQGSVDVQ